MEDRRTGLDSEERPSVRAGSFQLSRPEPRHDVRLTTPVIGLKKGCEGSSRVATRGPVHALRLFKDAIAVMLEDQILTREEKRLIIKLAAVLHLDPEEPARAYQAILEGSELEAGRELSQAEQVDVYTRIFEVALLNASVSKDEFVVLAFLRSSFDISDEEHERIEAKLRTIVRMRFEDKNVVNKLLETLKDSVSTVGDLLDNIRTRRS